MNLCKTPEKKSPAVIPGRPERDYNPGSKYRPRYEIQGRQPRGVVEKGNKNKKLGGKYRPIYVNDFVGLFISGMPTDVGSMPGETLDACNG